MTREEFEALPADLYDACYRAELSLGTIEAAVAEQLDDRAIPGCDILKLIREHSSIEVRALRRMVVDDDWIDATAHRALDT